MQNQYTSQNPFIIIPKRKIDDAIEDIKNVHLNIKTNKLSSDGVILVNAIHKWADANIPVDYWFREMSSFTGSQALQNVYKEITSDIKKSYKNGNNYCLAAAHGRGKKLSLETELPTPNGFVQLKDLKEGDKLFDENGNVCKVLKLHPISESPESYKVIFDDGSEINACAEHLWLTYTRKNRKKHTPPSIKTTKEILETLRVNKDNRCNHSIPCTKPLKYSRKKLLIDPYVLGCWLGDGSSIRGNIECADHEILNNINNAGYSVTLLKHGKTNDKSKSRPYRIGDILKTPRKIGKLTKQLKELNLLKNKHIPDIYLRSSVNQRLSLLQGLMDTDGCCSKDGMLEFCSAIPELANGVLELVRSFGIKANVKKSKTFYNGKRCKDRYRIVFKTSLPVFRIKRKLNNISGTKTPRAQHRYIVDVVPIDPIPMRCITVDSPSHLYLVTRSCIPTHNTMTSACILKRVVETGKYSGLYVNLVDIVNIIAAPNADAEQKEEARRTLISVDFLVIDEFDIRFMGSDNAADLFGRILEPVLRTRIQNNLPTIICTNSIDPTAAFSGPLQASFKSLMNKIKTIPVLGKDHRENK